MGTTTALTVALLLASTALGQDARPAGAQPPGGGQGSASGQRKTYKLGPDSLPQDGVPKGKLEGPILFHSRVFEGTVRQYWVFVPVQYTPDKPACVLVFQDGQRAVNPSGVLRVPTVLDNLIHKGDIP